jgi:TonB family protein
MRCRAPAIGWIALLLFCWLTPAHAAAQTQPAQDTNSSKNDSGEKVYRVGGGVRPPHVTYDPSPEFSERARKVGYEGTDVLQVVVDADGKPRDIQVTRPLGLGLDEKAIEAVRRWRFEPSLKDGEPVAVRINVEVSFRLYASGNLAQTLFQRANAGDAKAQFEAAQLLFSDPDLASDGSRGLAYLEKAAKQGLPKAQFGMGEYFSSRGYDLVTAYVWYALAERSHFKDSDKKLKELAEKMTPEQLTEARGRAEGK